MQKNEVKFCVVKAKDGSSEALDFQLASLLGYKIHENIELKNVKYFIVANDTGYDRLVEFWSEKGVFIQRIVNLKCDKVSNVSVKKNTTKENKKVDKQMIIEYTNDIQNTDKLVEIVNSSKTRVEVNNKINKLLKDSKRGSIIYNALKPLLNELGKK